MARFKTRSHKPTVTVTCVTLQIAPFAPWPSRSLVQTPPQRSPCKPSSLHLTVVLLGAQQHWSSYNALIRSIGPLKRGDLLCSMVAHRCRRTHHFRQPSTRNTQRLLISPSPPPFPPCSLLLLLLQTLCNLTICGPHVPILRVPCSRLGHSGVNHLSITIPGSNIPVFELIFPGHTGTQDFMAHALARRLARRMDLQRSPRLSHLFDRWQSPGVPA